MPNNATKRIKSALKSPKQKSYIPFALITFALVVFITGAFILFYKNINKVLYTDAQIGNQTFKLEVADTDAKRVKGLSERNGLDTNAGMLFDFKQDGDWRIWMIQMRFPIDIIWLDSDKSVIHIKENARPADFPERYAAPQFSRYVIELNSGQVEEAGLKIGDTVTFDYP